MKKILFFIFLTLIFYYLYLNFLDDYTLNKVDTILSLVTNKEGIFFSFSAFMEKDGSAFQRIMNPVIGFMSGNSSYYSGVGLDAYRYIYPTYILEHYPYAMKFETVSSAVNGASYITPKSLYAKVYAEMGAFVFILFIGYLFMLYYKILKLKANRYYDFLTIAYVLAVVLVIQGDSIIYLNYFFLITLIHVIVFKPKRGAV